MATKTPPEDVAGYAAIGQRLRRRIKLLSEKGIIDTSQTDNGLIFIKSTNNLIYLIKAKNYSTPPEEDLKDNRKGIYDFPKRARPERMQAIKKAVKSDAWMLPEVGESIGNEYTEYIEDIKNRFCLLIPKDDPGNPEKIVKIPYKTRFTNKKMQYDNLKKFEDGFARASELHKRAVFLTLTTDPKRFVSSWHANRHFQTAWNRYMLLLTKKAGGIRPEYIVVFEFTRFIGKDGAEKRGGLLHAHAVFFGTSWMASAEEISADWSHCGQGEIIHPKAISHNGDGVWNWVRGAPPDAKGKKPADYLSKYLKKALFAGDDMNKADEHAHALYWTFNKRFFSYSRRLVDPKIKLPPSDMWYFLGSAHIDDIPNTLMSWLEIAKKMGAPPSQPYIIPADTMLNSPLRQGTPTRPPRSPPSFSDILK